MGSDVAGAKRDLIPVVDADLGVIWPVRAVLVVAGIDVNLDRVLLPWVGGHVIQHVVVDVGEDIQRIALPQGLHVGGRGIRSSDLFVGGDRSGERPNEVDFAVDRRRAAVPDPGHFQIREGFDERKRASCAGIVPAERILSVRQGNVKLDLVALLSAAEWQVDDCLPTTVDFLDHAGHVARAVTVECICIFAYLESKLVTGFRCGVLRINKDAQVISFPAKLEAELIANVDEPELLPFERRSGTRLERDICLENQRRADARGERLIDSAEIRRLRSQLAVEEEWRVVTPPAAGVIETPKCDGEYTVRM